MVKNDRKRFKEKIDGDYISGWAFRVHKAFLDQLDVTMSERVKTQITEGPKAETDQSFLSRIESDEPPYISKKIAGKKQWTYRVLTQGECYCFDRGHMIHSQDGKTTVQVDTAEPATKHSQGIVKFAVYYQNIPAGMATVNQAKFVEILQKGNLPPLHSGYTFDGRLIDKKD